MRHLRGAPLLVLTGCNALVGIGDLTTGRDGGVADAAIVIDAMPNTVVGTSTVTWVKRDGTTQNTPEDLSGYTIRALVPDGTAWVTRDGVGHADGTFTISDVPDGTTYLLELIRPNATVPQFFATSRHELELGYVTIGRPDGVSATLPTPLTMQATGMDAWRATDSLLLDSFNNGTENYVAGNPTASNLPAVGATALAGTSIDWRAGYTYDVGGAAPFLIDASKGDDLFVAHSRTTRTPDGAGRAVDITTIVDTFESTAVTMTDGNTAQVTATFQPVTADHTQAFTADLGQLRALGTSAGHRNDTFACTRFTNAAAAYGGQIGPSLWQVLGRPARWTPQAFITGSSFGNPFPTTWGGLFTCSFAQSRYWRLPTNDALVQWNIGVYQVENATDDYFFTPRTRAPTQITVGGQPFLDGGAVTLAPEGVSLGWAPVVGATAYEIQLRRIYANGNTARAEVIAVLTTGATSATLPPTLFQPGEFYQFFVKTEAMASGYAQGHLRRTAFPLGFASVVSGLFRVSSTCGDGHVDAGEACDQGADSPMCDRDCSAAMCGDGLRNAAANEQCDDGLPSYTCDLDCTPVACGDGVYNPFAEQCDDGNQNPGDGCDADCHLERCGNGALDAGEGCDDGDTTPTDGCDETCRVEAGFVCTGAPSVCTPT